MEHRLFIITRVTLYTMIVTIDTSPRKRNAVTQRPCYLMAEAELMEANLLKDRDTLL